MSNPEYKHTALITDRFIERFEGYAKKALKQERFVRNAFTQAGLEDPTDCGDAKACAAGHLSLFTFGPMRSFNGEIQREPALLMTEPIIMGDAETRRSVYGLNDEGRFEDAMALLIRNLKRNKGKRLVNVTSKLYPGQPTLKAHPETYAI